MSIVRKITVKFSDGHVIEMDNIPYDIILEYSPIDVLFNIDISKSLKDKNIASLYSYFNDVLSYIVNNNINSVIYEEDDNPILILGKSMVAYRYTPSQEIFRFQLVNSNDYQLNIDFNTPKIIEEGE